MLIALIELLIERDFAWDIGMHGVVILGICDAMRFRMDEKRLLRFVSTKRDLSNYGAVIALDLR